MHLKLTVKKYDDKDGCQSFLKSILFTYFLIRFISLIILPQIK